MRPVIVIGLVFSLFASLSLAGCGVKGPMEPPQSAEANGSAPTGAGTPGTAPKKEKHKPFILDGLL